MKPLDDITVIEVDNWMAAPSCGAILADMGATVIKVEPLAGDPMRGMQRPAKLPDELKSYDFQFDVDNRGKKSVAIDISNKEGASVLHRLVADADVFLCNLLVERQERFGMDPATLLALNPRLVHATFTGYGTTGPEASRPGYDVTAFFGRSGLYDAMREGEDGDVPMARPAQGDHTAGLALYGAIVSALRLVERSGEGQVVESSLYETAVWTQATDYSVTAVDKAPLRQRGRRNQIIATANRYPCGDGKWVVFNMPNDSAWPHFARTIGCESALDDERFLDLRSRFKNMPALVDIVDQALAARSRDEWGPIFDEADLIWGPVLALHEVVVDPQAIALGMFPTITSPEIGDYSTVANPMKFRTADVGPQGPHPKIGEHTRSVLGEAGLSGDEIDSLIGSGIVGELAADA
ncbi:MAG: crotonobetainyl-CoA:carnitine CoA-transferase CaiB-like acyl-CoA transferase [Paracrocinitomix sp.]|jgi:crotonobetainyl-CoA:carnitine CoA-transferase CaiB-like acyl-CoA transferase